MMNAFRKIQKRFQALLRIVSVNQENAKAKAWKDECAEKDKQWQRSYWPPTYQELRPLLQKLVGINPVMSSSVKYLIDTDDTDDKIYHPIGYVGKRPSRS